MYSSKVRNSFIVLLNAVINALPSHFCLEKLVYCVPLSHRVDNKSFFGFHKMDNKLILVQACVRIITQQCLFTVFAN